MVTVVVTLDVLDEYADPQHESGLTNEGYEALMAAVSGLAASVEIVQGS